MNENFPKTIKLAGNLARTTTWIKISRQGDVVIEYYDFSEEAESFLGNDTAYMLTIKHPDRGEMLRLLAGDAAQEIARLPEDEAILKLMSMQFGDYFEIKQWLKANNIAFQKAIDSWA